MGSSPSKVFAQIIMALVAMICVVILMQTFVIQPYRIPSESMVPTLQVGDRILVNKLSNKRPARGDVYVFKAPVGALVDKCAVRAGPGWQQPCPSSIGPSSQQAFVKRVIGLPGERIRFNNGQVLINDVALNEPYARPCNERDFCSFPLTIIVPPGQYYMLGDNRSFSNDSRVWGPVPKSNLVGEVIGKYWPGIGGLR